MIGFDVCVMGACVGPWNALVSIALIDDTEREEGQAR